MPVAAATQKGLATREMIVERACELASRLGLEGVSIGELASATGMSKSGVFAHFGSREDLQLTVLDWIAARFVDAVMRPALKAPRGLPRLRAIAQAWIDWIDAHPDGCVFQGAAMEYDGRPGPLRDHVAELTSAWQAQLVRAVDLAIGEGHLRAGTDSALVAFQLSALLNGLHLARLHQPDATRDLGPRAIEDLLDRHRVADAP